MGSRGNGWALAFCSLALSVGCAEPPATTLEQSPVAALPTLTERPLPTVMLPPRSSRSGGEIVHASVKPSTPRVCRRERLMDGVQYECRLVQGDFTNLFLIGAECAPNSVTCTRGVLSGDVEGTYDFFFRSQVAAGDPENVQRELFVGDSVVQLDEGGVLFGDDFGTFDPGVTGQASFRTLIDIVGGDDGLQGIRGHLLARGELDLLTGDGGGTYSGELCNPVTR